MSRIDEKYRYKITPAANSKMIVKGEKYRFTILSDGLIRMEYSEQGIFEDRATQTVINRDFPCVNFELCEDYEKIVITTKQMKLTYYKNEEFSCGSLYAMHKDDVTKEITYWRYGSTEALRNLKGTVRTLDLVDGEIPLEDGIMSRSGFAVIDDSKSVIIAEDGWIDERLDGNVDLYLFSYKDDYYGALSAFYMLTGSTSLLPRYALGNMWSRYYPYSQQEYLDLMDRFKREGYPFSVAVIDMDWHKYITHWTGYTWNDELFPDYKEFLRELHKRNLEPTLNLHPADGVQPEENMYSEFAEAMGKVDGEEIPFDISNPLFLESYFRILHNPYEEDGVAFWWIDWQQGNTTRIKNLDPLWMLNHYHTLDLMKNGKRGLILSRYAGFGSHRYPLGFSGDTVISWDSLDFQPYFTIAASNAGYTWWSHDIGGHMRGIRDDELVARWVQFGVFSPISRLHSFGVLMSKEPWNYNEVAEKSMKRFLRLRHELIPYIYTMNYRTNKYNKPLVTPIYYEHPVLEEAYNKEYRNEYYFGSEMLVMPITKPADRATCMGHAQMLLPEGVWFDFFNGTKYNGGKTVVMYRNLYEMPVLIKAGGIIPMSGYVVNDVSNPKNILVRVFAGADNTFEMYEDDGASMKYEVGEYAITRFHLKHSKKPVFTIDVEGDKNVIPDGRNYTVEFNGYTLCNSFSVTEGGEVRTFDKYEKDGRLIIEIKDVKSNIEIKFIDVVDVAAVDNFNKITHLLIRCQENNDIKNDIYEMIKAEKPVAEIMVECDRKNIDKDIKLALAELLTSC